MSAGSPGTEHPTGWNSSGNDLLRERCKTLSLQVRGGKVVRVRRLLPSDPPGAHARLVRAVDVCGRACQRGSRGRPRPAAPGSAWQRTTARGAVRPRAMEQPNITSGGAGVLTPRFWLMVVLAGVTAGLLGALMMAILFNEQYAAFGYHEGSLQYGTRRRPDSGEGDGPDPR